MTRPERIARGKELLRRIMETGLRHGDNLLTEHERQDVYVLERALEPSPCPSCNKGVTRLHAANEDFLDLGSPYPDDGYTCPNCQERLRYVLPYIGHYQWHRQAAETAHG